MKHTTECHTCAIGESTQWKGESGRRKVKVSSHFNVYLQSVACCMLKEADEVISSGHRTSVAKRSTQERDKEEWKKMVWHVECQNTPIAVCGRKREKRVFEIQCCGKGTIKTKTPKP